MSKHKYIYVVETCCDYEGCQCIGVFNTLKSAKQHVLKHTDYADTIQITRTTINTFIDNYKNKNFAISYNTKYKKWS